MRSLVAASITAFAWLIAPAAAKPPPCWFQQRVNAARLPASTCDIRATSNNTWKLTSNDGSHDFASMCCLEDVSMSLSPLAWAPDGGFGQFTFDSIFGMFLRQQSFRSCIQHSPEAPTRWGRDRPPGDSHSQANPVILKAFHAPK